MSWIERGPEMGPERGGNVERGPEGGAGRREPTPEYVTGLRALAEPAIFDQLMEDFATHADLLRNEDRLPRSVRGMLWVGRLYHQGGSTRSALASMDDEYERYSAGIQDDIPETVQITGFPEKDGSRTEQGVLAGILGAGRHNDGTPYFNGIVALGKRGQNGLVAVTIDLDGGIALHPSYQESASQQAPRTLRDLHDKIIGIYPPKPPHKN